MGKRRKNKRGGRRPDDYFSLGPLELARFGKLIVGRSRTSQDQSDAMHAEMAAHLPTVIAEIDELTRRIADRVAGLPPDRLLHRAWWELAAVVIGVGGKSGSDAEKALAQRMVDYVQSVIASVQPMPTDAYDVGEEDWAALSQDVCTLFQKVSGEYQMCLTAHRLDQNPNFDMALDEFRHKVEIYWMNVRGQRYQPHEVQALLDVLTPHSDVLQRLFDVDAATIANELAKMLSKLSRGVAEAFAELEELQEATVGRMEKLAADTGATAVETLSEEIFKDPDLAARRDKIAGEIAGVDLFDTEKITNLPKALLDELAWSPGEETEFFSPGEFRGWPLRIWPIMKRPFIRLDGRILCFDVYSLFDNFYRVLQRTIFRLEPGYKQTWNNRQKAVSEELPFTYLEKLLPSSRFYRPVYYRWKASNGRAQWYETDGLLVYDDHLFVIEVKAGAFTYTSPATDLPAHITSLENLVLSPASQGSRFVDYLESADEVPIAGVEHNEIARLRRSDFRHVTICAITLDAFTGLAARVQHLRSVGIDVGQRPVWSLSIDDLRVYADLFDNPLVFLHFVEQRMCAARSDLVDLNDEMDHLGLYIAQNNYSQYAAEVMRSELASLNFHGFKSPIDDYYAAILQDESTIVPKQEIPRRLAEIITFLGSSKARYRAELASYLLNAAGDLRSELSAAIDQQLRDNAKMGRARPLSTYGEMRLTLFTWSPSAPRRAATAIDHTRVIMVASGENTRPLIELEYSADGVLTNIHWQRVGLAGLVDAELDRLRAEGIEVHKRRVQAVRRERKIGANERCPCGSGKKYKRCCRA